MTCSLIFYEFTVKALLNLQTSRRTSEKRGIHQLSRFKTLEHASAFFDVRFNETRREAGLVWKGSEEGVSLELQGFIVGKTLPPISSPES